MKKAERMFLACIAFFSAVILYKSFSLSMGSEYTIGPGFFPRVISSLLLTVSFLIYLKTFKHNNQTDKKFFIDRNLSLKALIFFIALIIAVILVSFLGMFPAILLFMVFSFKYIEGNGFKSSIIMAVTVSLIVFLIFKVWLGVPLPGLNLGGV